MSIAKRIAEALRRPRRRGTANERHVAAIERELQDQPPLTLVGMVLDDDTIGLGVRLDESLCADDDT